MNINAPAEQAADRLDFAKKFGNEESKAVDEKLKAISDFENQLASTVIVQNEIH